MKYRFHLGPSYEGKYAMAGIVFLSALVGMFAAGSVLFTGASFWFAFCAYVACGVAMIMTAVILTAASSLFARTTLSGGI